MKSTCPCGQLDPQLPMVVGVVIEEFQPFQHMEPNFFTLDGHYKTNSELLEG
jgi:hypothetical protein